MNDQDLDNHPSHLAYCAGVKLAKEHPENTIHPIYVQKMAEEYDDPESFIDGYWCEQGK